MDESRIVVAGKQLAVVIKGWLRATPERLWGKDPNYEKLRGLKRQDVENEPDPRREVADYIVARLEEVGWEVSHSPPKQPPG